MTEASYFNLAQAVNAKAQAQAQLDAQLKPLRDQIDQLMIGDLATQITELEGKITAHCVARAEELRNLQGKDSGAASFVQDGLKVTVTVPKTVKWDGTKLAELAERMRTHGEDPANYLKLTYGVEERRYKEWPVQVQAAFLDARTVQVGRPKIEMKEA